MTHSLYEDLKVYKSSLDLAVYFENVVRHFDRYHKYAIGSELRTLARRIIVLVAKANTMKHRKECLAEAIEKLEELKILVRLCQEIKAFKSSRSYEFSSKKIIGIAKQCEGWRQSCSSNAS